MKKLLLFFCALMIIAISFISTSCNHRTQRVQDRRDSIWFVHMLEKCQPTPTTVTFEDAIDAIRYQDSEQRRLGNYELFLELDPQTITNVCQVLSHNLKKFTIDQIVDEYINCKRVYDGLIEEEAPPKTAPNKPENDTIDVSLIEPEA